MAAARAQHVTEIIEPALIAGKIVVCDRFIDSTIAYQGYGRKLGPEKIKVLNEMAVNGAIPDLTIFLDVRPDIGYRRRSKAVKVKDRLDLQQKEFYERVYKGYQEIAKQNGRRYQLIDASKSIEKVALEVWQIVKKVLDKNNGKKARK